MLVVCSRNDLRGFTYGRIYIIGYKADMTEGGYIFATNDKGIIVGEPKRYFKTIEQWRKNLDDRNKALNAVFTGVL
jgi:hypothetical protein